MFKKFINRVFYSLYLIEKSNLAWQLWRGEKNAISKNYVYNMLGNLKFSAFFLLTGLAIVGYKWYPTMAIIWLLLYCFALYYTYKYLSDDIIDNYEEYYAQFEKDSYSKKLLWGVISCLFYLLAFVGMFFSVIIFSKMILV